MLDPVANIRPLRYINNLVQAPQASEELFSGTSTDSANGWQPDFSTRVKAWGVNDYYWCPITGVEDAVSKSQMHLIDLIRYYEGDPKNGYKAKAVYKDLGGTCTITYGYGITQIPEVNLAPSKNEQEAYNMMLLYFERVAMEDIKATITSDIFNKAPNSVKEALLDFAFKHGRGLLNSKKDIFKTAIQNEDWPTLLETLVHAIPGAEDAEQVENAGLYRRSLSRAILATRDLNDTPEIRKTIKDIYDKSVECAKDQNKSLVEFDMIYKTYSDRSVVPDDKPVTNDKKINKYKVKNQISLYSTATALKVDGVNLKDLIEEIARLNNIKLGKADKNGFPIPERTFVANEEIKLPTEFAGKKLKDLAAQSWLEIKDENISQEQIISDENNPTAVASSYQLKKGEGYLQVQKNLYPDIVDYQERLKIATELEKYNGIPNDSLREGMTLKALPAPINNE